MLSIDLRRLTLLMLSLFPIVCTDCAPAKDDINKANSFLNFDCKHNAITVSYTHLTLPTTPYV